MLIHINDQSTKKLLEITNRKENEDILIEECSDDIIDDDPTYDDEGQNDQKEGITTKKKEFTRHFYPSNWHRQ